MRNRGFPETRSPGTFVSAAPQQEKEKVGAAPDSSVITGDDRGPRTSSLVVQGRDVAARATRRGERLRR